MASNNQLDIESLIDLLTLEEKISLLAGNDFWHTVPIPRLNIPSLRVSDGPNGVRGVVFFGGVPSNCFTCGTGMAATWNKELLNDAGKLMGQEAKARAVHCILGPTCNIARSPLGGRAFESYSEDPILSGHAAASIVSGIQSEKVLSCLKHFVCNDQEADRKAVNSILTERALREIYLKPFQIAVRDANPKSIMTAYNKVGGEHVSQSKKFLETILRDEWKWEGMTMSDWFGVYSTKESLDAGLNLEMPGPTRFRLVNQTAHKVFSNELHMDTINKNVRRVLEFVNEGMKIGLGDSIVENENDDPEAAKLMRRVGDESIVLLKNEENILPLNKSEKQSIALIGPNVKAARYSGGGSASMDSRYTVTPYDGILRKIKEGGDKIVTEYALGAFLEKTCPDIGKSLVTAEGKPGLQAKLYKQPHGEKNRESFDTLDLKTSQVFLSDYKSPKLDAGDLLFYADIEGFYTPEETGTYVFGCSCLGTAQVFIDGKMVVDNKTKQVKGDAFFLGMGTREELGEISLEKGKKYHVKVEFGTSPTASVGSEYKELGGVLFGCRLKTTDEENLERAVEIAKNNDKVVMVVGLSKEWESEGFDRPNMDIPGWTNKVIEEVTKVNKNVVIVNQSGSPVSMPWADKVQAIVHAWYGGNELGNTIADVLFGDHNPSGKLSLTFPKRLEDNPSYLTFGSDNGQVIYGEDVFVGYRHFEKRQHEVLFPFGFGLSYTKFEFANLKATTDESNVKVSVDVSNVGDKDGAEVVQVYIAHVEPKVSRPVKELKDFAKVFLKAGETKTVSVTISIKEATSYWDNYYNQWSSDKGQYKVLVGNSSDNILLQGEFETSKTFRWLGL